VAAKARLVWRKTRPGLGQLAARALRLGGRGARRTPRVFGDEPSPERS
jgi:hypothetical protein